VKTLNTIGGNLTATGVIRMYSKLCCTVFLFVTLLAGTSAAKEDLKLIDTINTAPLCYALSEFMSYYDKSWKDDLSQIYTNYSNANYVLQFLAMKRGEMEKVDTQIIMNTAGVLFNETATEKRRLLFDYSVRFDQKSVRTFISKAYNEKGCSQLSKPIGLDEYKFPDDDD